MIELFWCEPYEAMISEITCMARFNFQSAFRNKKPIKTKALSRRDRQCLSCEIGQKYQFGPVKSRPRLAGEPSVNVDP